jgi:4-phosphopantoate--beta-alanine ligase
VRLIPEDHPRHRSLVVRESLARYAKEGVVTLEGLTAHGRGEAFDYLIGEKTMESALLAERTAAALLYSARHPVISVNGNTAALAAGDIADLQKISGAQVEVNLFHRTPQRIEKVTKLLEDSGVVVLEGNAERLLPLSHERAYCLRHGIYGADVVLVPLEDGDRCEALVSMGKTVIVIDLNPLSRSARYASLTVVDELTRAIPRITRFSAEMDEVSAAGLISTMNNNYFLKEAIKEIARRLSHVLD